jgi:hypothetical protein
MCIYIYKLRERESEREGERAKEERQRETHAPPGSQASPAPPSLRNITSSSSLLSSQILAGP